VPSKWKRGTRGVSKGSKGSQQGEQGESARGAKENAPCIYVTIVRMTER
jgi:hypothetical protein